MVMSAAKAHRKPMKSADEGYWSTADALLNLHSLKRAERVWFVLRHPGTS